MERPSCGCSSLLRMKVSLTRHLALRLRVHAEGTSCFVGGCVWCRPSVGNRGGCVPLVFLTMWICFDWWLSCVQDRVFFSKEDPQKGRNGSQKVCPQRGDIRLWTPPLWEDQRKVKRERANCTETDVRCRDPMLLLFPAGIVRVATQRTWRH